MSDVTANLGLPYILAAQAQKHVTHNEALRLLDGLVQLSVKDRDLAEPPDSPSDGDRYLVADEATGEWSGWDGDIAMFADGAWWRLPARTGWLCFVEDENVLLVRRGSSWEAVGADAVTTEDLENGAIALLGVNTGADANNRLAVKSDGVLLSHDDVTPGTGDMRVTLNKAAAAQDAGFSFQDGWSARALIGLLGDDDFSIRVSPDGSAFHQALVVDKDTGNVAIGAGSDANNKLLVSGENMLFTNSGNLRFTFSKGSSGDDVALTFQTNFSARALIGLLGDDHFTFKVSPDGSNYKTGLIVDKDSGQVSFPEGPKFSAYMVWGGPDQWIGADGWTKIGFNNTRHNDQAAFDASDHSFVAPADGYYLFGAKARFRSDGTDPTKIQFGFSINFAVPTLDNIVELDPAMAPSQTILQLTALLKLNAGDKVYVLTYFAGEDGYILDNENYFWGHRVP